MIKLKNLSKRFEQKVILDNVSLDIPDGQRLSVIGPSGCGKSTLLRLIIGLLKPNSGDIYINEKNITFFNEEQFIKLRQNIGMVFQSSALFDSMNVRDNVAFALHEHTKLSEAEIDRIVGEKLRMVDLEGTEELMPEELSGGMQKRVSFARAIAMDPKMILYDEPTTGLDPITSTAIENLINKMSRELKVTTIIVTHQLSTIFRASDRIVMLNSGKFIDSGSPEEARNSSNDVVRNFLRSGIE
jgi:phospholipid/cholesterol/gamma-HCH transport system ATP-binding protein